MKMGRLCDDESGLKKGPWTPEEDERLVKYITKHGHGSCRWRALPRLAGLNRCGKSCRLRWTNYLRPDIKRGKFSQQEQQTILNLHAMLGNKWSAIATHLPGRTDNEIKNFWNTHLKKKLIQMGFDPMTHRPRPRIRTDDHILLPHLIALAAKLMMIENPAAYSWEYLEQAMQAAQMARLNRFLHNLLQPPGSILLPPTSNFQNNNNIVADASILGHLESAGLPPLLAGDFFQETTTMPFSHLPDLLHNVPIIGGGCDFGGVLLSSPSWMRHNMLAAAAAATVAETSVGGTAVEGCSVSSYGLGSLQMWSELLEDPIFHEIV